MKVVPITVAQQTQAVSLKASFTTAQQAAQTAHKAYIAFLSTAAGVTLKPGQRLQLTDDGSAVVLIP
jgi:hypothetical protein